MSSEIILIGPVGSGKSTIGALLAEELGIPLFDMDERRWAYYQEIGFSEEKQKEISQRDGILGVYRYWKLFEIHAVERALAEHHDCVFDFGAGHSVYEDDALFRRARTALAPFENVVLLLPSASLEESGRILRQGKWDGMAGDFDLNGHFLKHHSNFDLAKHTAYTIGKTPEETRDEVLRMIKVTTR